MLPESYIDQIIAVAETGSTILQEVMVSVVMPTFDTDKDKLRASISSVLGQTETDIELLVIDDGSDTPFAGLEDELSDSRLRFVRNQSNEGVAVARNEGIRLAKGKYIAFLDAGDLWVDTKIERQLECIMSDPRPAMVFCGARFVADGIEPIEKYPRFVSDWYVALLEGMPITGSCSAVLVEHKTVHELGGFYTEADIPEDRELWLRIARLGPTLGYVNEILVEVEVQRGSRSADPRVKESSYKAFIAMYADEMRRHGVLRKAVSNYHANIAHKYFLLGATGGGIKHALQSLVYNYRRRIAMRILYYIWSRQNGYRYQELVAAKQGDLF